MPVGGWGQRRGRDPGVLGNPGFRRLWWANLAGDVGEQFSALALSVTAVLALHASALQVGVITALGYGPSLALSLAAGVWVDRTRRRNVLVAADLCRFVAVATVPVAFAVGRLAVGQLMAVAAVVGAAGVFFDVAHTSVLPALVSRERVSEANARLQTSDTTLRTIGPGLAGQLLRLTGGPGLYAVTAAMHLVSSALILRLPVRESHPSDRAREPFWPSMRSGLAFLAGQPVLRTFTLSNAATNLGAGVFMTVVPLFVLRDLRIAAPAYALAVSVGSTGGIVGSLVAMRIRSAVGEVRTKVLANCLLPLAFAAVPMARVTTVPLVVLGSSEFFFGLILTIASVSSTGVRAAVTPSHLLGRVAAASRFVTQGAIPVGALLAGLVTARAGAPTGLWLAAGSAAGGGVLMLASPIRSMRDARDAVPGRGSAGEGAGVLR